MRTKKQIDASRENGRKSVGATTPEGKTRIVNANLDSGIFAETEVLVWEHQYELQEVKDEYYLCHPPASPEARCLVDQLIKCEWQLRRLSSAEDSLWNQFYADRPHNFEGSAYALREGEQTFARLQHRINSTRRAFHAALKELERLEARDRDVVVIEPGYDSDATDSPESKLPVLGSLRKNDSAISPARQSPATPSPEPGKVEGHGPGEIARAPGNPASDRKDGLPYDAIAGTVGPAVVRRPTTPASVEKT